MWTITSVDNVTGYTTMEAQLWPYKGIRPFVLKDKPEIVITSRVHPSQVVGSIFVEGIVEQLIKGTDFELLKHFFIFRIIPMMNPDGIQNGHYRLDNFYQNLNRFYGHSDMKKTPSVFAVEKLLIDLRGKNKLFWFMDIHGHNSPKPSFLFGNFTNSFFQSLQNRVFARILQGLSNQSFSYSESQFSKKNMQMKQRYDQHSKQGCARVFAFQGTCPSQPNLTSNQTTTIYVEHSYTLQVQPFLTKISKKGVESENQLNSTFNQANQLYTEDLIYKQYKNLARQVLIAILQLIGCNTVYKLGQMETVEQVRKRCQRQIGKVHDPAQKSKKQLKEVKEINRDIMETYNKKWSFFSAFKEYLEKNQNKKTKLDDTPMFKAIFGKIQKSSKTLSTNKLSSNKLNIFRSRSKLSQKQRNVLNLNSSMENINSSQIYVRIDPIKKEGTQAVNAKIGKSFNDSIQRSIEKTLSNEKLDISTNQITLKQFTPSFSLLRKREHIHNKNESQMEKRMKRLIFKHKTQIQTHVRENYNSLKNKKIQLQLKELIQQSKQKQKTKRMKQEETSMINQNQTSVKAPPKQVKYSLQQSLPKDAIEWKNGKKYKKTEIKQYFKAQVISSHNPTIKQLLKRVSFVQRDKKSGISQENGTNVRIRSSQSVLNNLIGIRSTKEVILIQSNIKKEQVPHTSENRVIVYDSNRNFLPLMYQQKILQKIYSSPSHKRIQWQSERSQKPVLSPPPSISKGKKKTSPKKQRQQQQSLERVREKNLEFIERAKNALLEKKRILKIQQP